MIVFLIAGTIFFWRALVTPFRGYTTPMVDVEVRRGAKTAVVLRHLEQEGVLRDSLLPLVYLKTLRRGDSIKAGIYRFDHSMTAIEVLEKMISGDVILKSVTVREGLDRFSIGELMSSEGFGTRETWKKVTANPELIQDLDPDATSLEGYLFPDTYKLTPGTSPQSIVATMVQNFRRNFGGELAYITTGLSLHDTVTLASIVETEAKLDSERRIIASVYLNRVRRKMPLQADPTVIYALKLASRWDGNIRKGDLRIDSPYNTYDRRGFPPGPIANPGKASLHAAANPATTDFLYFVSRNDGSHVFAQNLEEHNRNVAYYQKNAARRRALQSAGQR